MSDKVNSFIYWIITVFLAGVLAVGLFFSYTSKLVIYDILHNKNSFYMILLWVYAGIILLSIYLIKKIKTEKQAYIIIFIFSFLLRAAFICINKYIPVSDFTNYYQFGEYFLQGDYARIADLCMNYDIPKFGGMAVLSYLISLLFSTKLIGYQLCNSIVISLICVLIYLLMKKINRNAALTAAFLYAVYPASIVSSAITSNHHGAVFFTLLSIAIVVYTYEKTGMKKYCFAVFGGVSWAMADFCHPSAVIVILAAAFYFFTRFLKRKDGKFQTSYLKYFFIMLISYYIFIKAVLLILLHMGVIHTVKPADGSMYSRIALGFNYETSGTWNEEDAVLFASAPEGKEDEFYKDIFIDRLTSHTVKETLHMIKRKLEIVWFESDPYIKQWYLYGYHQEYGEIESLDDFMNSLASVDMLFLKLIYVFAFLEIIMQQIKDKNFEMRFMMWLTAGWIGVYMISEIQGRYRYLGMPYMFMFAAAGIYRIYIILKNWRRYYEISGKIRNNNKNRM